MPLSGLSTLSISDPGWSGLRELRVANVSASWTLNRPGRLSATLAADEAWLLGIDDYKGKWVRWDHPTMGPWGGIVEDVHIELGRGTVELVCAGFLQVLRHYRTKKHYRQVSSPAGSLVLRAFADLAVKLPFDEIRADTDGDPVALTWRGDLLSSVVSRLASASNHQYDAILNDDWTIDFEFRRQVGEDKSGGVALYEGYQVVDGPVTESIANLVNDLLAVSAEVPWDEAPTVVAVDGDSVVARGRRQGVARYYGFIGSTALRSRARADLARLAKPAIPVVLRLSDREPLLADIRQGDTIRFASASANKEYLVDLTGRAVDAETGIVSLVGDAEEA